MTDYLQDLRYKLQKRVNRLRTTSMMEFHQELQRFCSFLDNNEVLVGLISELRAKQPTSVQEVADLQKGFTLYGTTDSEHAAIGYEVLRRALQNPGPQGFGLMDFVPTSRFEDQVEKFCELYLLPFYEYVDERIEDKNLVLALLVRFKHSVEWFRREALLELWRSDTRRGEKNLATVLYEYLYEHGVDFSIEPESASGEADMVSSQTSASRLIADAKIFDPEGGKGASYIKSAFNQVHIYTHDYNSPLGYLVVFNVSGRQLHIQTSNQSEVVPRVTLNNKTIFLVQVDISKHETSASKRGQSEAVIIREDELVRELGG